MKHQEQIAIVAHLRSFYAKDHEEWLGDVLRCWIADPVKPRTNEGNLRINPIVILLTGMAVLAGGTFFFFSLVQQ
jgi:hypothetical protein